jgi:hypothetical protein
MNLVVDESVDKLIVDTLREAGHNVLYISEFAPSIDDEIVLNQANQNDACWLRRIRTLVNLSFVKD